MFSCCLGAFVSLDKGPCRTILLNKRLDRLQACVIDPVRARDLIGHLPFPRVKSATIPCFVRQKFILKIQAGTGRR
jgi:hypothetical protein